MTTRYFLSKGEFVVLLFTVFTVYNPYSGILSFILICFISPAITFDYITKLNQTKPKSYSIQIAWPLSQLLTCLQ